MRQILLTIIMILFIPVLEMIIILVIISALIDRFLKTHFSDRIIDLIGCAEIE